MNFLALFLPICSHYYKNKAIKRFVRDAYQNLSLSNMICACFQFTNYIFGHLHQVWYHRWQMASFFVWCDESWQKNETVNGIISEQWIKFAWWTMKWLNNTWNIARKSHILHLLIVLGYFYGVLWALVFISCHPLSLFGKKQLEHSV